MKRAFSIRILNDLLLDACTEDPAMSCPAPALLAALIEDGIKNDAGQTLWQHVVTCSSCADLYRRLSSFGQATSGNPIESERIWKSAQPRLESAVKRISAASVKLEPKPGGWFSLFFDVPYPAKWLLTACASLLVVGVGLVFYSSLVEEHPSTDGASTGTATRGTSGSYGNRPPAMPMSNPSSASRVEPDIDQRRPTGDDTSTNTSNDPTTFNAGATKPFVLLSTLSVTLEVDLISQRENTGYQIRGRLVPSSQFDSQVGFNQAYFSGTLSDDLSRCDISLDTVIIGGTPYKAATPTPAILLFDDALEDRPAPGASLRVHFANDVNFKARPS
jgi:hypothetical protein